MANTIKPKVMAVTFAVLTLILDVAGYLWHGIMGQPSMMNLMYAGFWRSTNMMAAGLVASVIGAYILGWLFAVTYNLAEKKYGRK